MSRERMSVRRSWSLIGDYGRWQVDGGGREARGRRVAPLSVALAKEEDGIGYRRNGC